MIQNKMLKSRLIDCPLANVLALFKIYFYNLLNVCLLLHKRSQIDLIYIVDYTYKIKVNINTNNVTNI